MHDVGIALHRHQPADLDAPDPGDPSEIVPAQVDEHNVLRPLLRVLQEFVGQPPVLLLIFPSAPRPGDGLEIGDPLFEADHDLRRGADEMEVIKAEEEHVGRGVDVAERPVEINRVRRGFPMEPLGEDDLDDIARGDVLLGLADHGAVGLRFHVGPEGGSRLPLAGGLLRRQRGHEKVRHLFDPADGPVVEIPQVLSFAGDGAGDDLDRVADIVEDDQRVGDKKDGLVVDGGVPAAGREALEIPDHVVAEKTHGPSEEPRQSHEGDGAVTAEDFLEKPQRIAPMRVPLHRMVFLDNDLFPPDAADDPRVRPEEAIPPPFLAPLHALQQKEMGAVGKLHEGRDGRFRVGEDLPADGDQVSFSRQFSECFKIRCVHGRFLFHRPSPVKGEGDLRLFAKSAKLSHHEHYKKRP